MEAFCWYCPEKKALIILIISAVVGGDPGYTWYIGDSVY